MFMIVITYCPIVGYKMSVTVMDKLGVGKNMNKCIASSHFNTNFGAILKGDTLQDKIIFFDLISIKRFWLPALGSLRLAATNHVI